MSAEILSGEEWIRVIEKRLGHKAFEVLSYTLRSNQSTGGFLGEHFTANVTVHLQQPEKSEKIFRFFVKAEPKVEPGKDSAPKLFNAFEKEGGTLGFLFDEIRTVLNDGGKNMAWACKCYYVREDVIVQEDLSEKGFRSFNMRDTLGYKHFVLVMQALANMHAASMIFEAKQPSQPCHLNAMYPDIFEETLFVKEPNHPGFNLVNVSIESMLLIVELIHGKEFLIKMNDQLREFMQTMYDLQKPSHCFRNVISQGDVMRDNFLFRHEGNEPVSVRIVDYQLTRYVPPANDVMTFLYLSSNREFRRQHTSQLQSVYYDQLSTNLKDHGFNPEEVLSWKEFKESCDYYKKLGLLMASVYYPVTLISSDNIKHVMSSSELERFFLYDRSPEIIYSFKNDDFYNTNIKEIIEEIVEECIADQSV